MSWRGAGAIGAEIVEGLVEGYQTYETIKNTADNLAKVANAVSKKNPQEGNFRKQRSDKGKKRGPQEKTKEKNNTKGMMKEDFDAPLNNNSKKNSDDNIHRSFSLYKEQQLTMSNAAEQEIPLGRIPKALSTTVPDYFTIKLRCYSQQTLTLVKGTVDYASTRINLNNLNTPYGADASKNYLGLSQWKALFGFFRIVENEIAVSAVHVASFGDTSSSVEARVGVKTTLEFSDNVVPRFLTPRQMEEGKGNITKNIHSMGADPIRSLAVLKHNYTPGQFHNAHSHITEKGDEEFWTPIASTTAAHDHYAHVGIAYLYPAELTTGNTVDVELELMSEVTVQFREVNDTILTTSQNDV